MTGVQANSKLVFLGVLAGLAASAVPFLSKTVREREEKVHAMRELSREQQEAAGAAPGST